MEKTCPCFMLVPNPENATRCLLCDHELDCNHSPNECMTKTAEGDKRDIYDIILDFRLVEIGLLLLSVGAYLLFRHFHGPLF